MSRWQRSVRAKPWLCINNRERGMSRACALVLRLVPPAVSFPKLKLKSVKFLPFSSLTAPLMSPNEICWQRSSAPAGSQNIGLVVWEAEEGRREAGKEKAEEGDDLTQSLSAHGEASWIFMLVSLWGLMRFWWNSVLTLDLEEHKQWWRLGGGWGWFRRREVMDLTLQTETSQERRALSS